jgi:hypothetical protein
LCVTKIDRNMSEARVDRGLPLGYHQASRYPSGKDISA